MDFITGLPLSRGYSTILVVVDRLTKSAHFGILLGNFTAHKTTELFIDIVVKIHGFPSSIISDCDPVFLSQFWDRLLLLVAPLYTTARPIIRKQTARWRLSIAVLSNIFVPSHKTN